MKLWQITLFPLTIIYKSITDFRNHLYNIGYKYSTKFQTNVISVGNLTVGGTGKTPHVEYLIRLLRNEYKISTLSRGYGRKTKGFLIADENSSAETIGDEPFQIYQKFKQEIDVTVGEERAFAIPKILFELPKTQVILLDDAYQHRPVKPQCNILITDFNRLFYKDFPFPSGMLRESRWGAKRADIVIVSKCPEDLSEIQKADIQANIKKYTQAQVPTFFTTLKYTQAQGVYTNAFNIKPSKKTKAIVFTGIANASLFLNYLQNDFEIIKHFEFSDHHHYTIKEVKKIKKTFKETQADILLSTEKDYVKFLREDFESILTDIPFFYIPIQVQFLEKEEVFQKLLRSFIVFESKTL